MKYPPQFVSKWVIDFALILTTIKTLFTFDSLILPLIYKY